MAYRLCAGSPIGHDDEGEMFRIHIGLDLNQGLFNHSPVD